MSMGKEQERRLMELLSKLAAREAGEPVFDATGSTLRMPEFGGQEHTDAKTLAYIGWIQSRRGFMDLANSWSGEGIFAFELTEDGRATLGEWTSSVVGEADTSADAQKRQSQPTIMMVHGSRDGRVPQVVEDIRLWCFEQGVRAYKAADLPNAGRFINDKVNSTIDNDKVNSTIDEADYYIVVLTADEELTTGAFRPRLNTAIEMGRLLDRDPTVVCVLKEDRVEMPSDYSNLVTEPLDNWRSILQRELREAGLL